MGRQAQRCGLSVNSSVCEKMSLLAGSSHWRTAAAPELGIAELVWSDGPHGLRKQEGKADALGIAESRPATCFPSASALACSFNPELVRAVGQAIGEEVRDQGVDVVLGPGVNIKRHPLCGRNFEYFSEDPLLSGELGAALVRGIQSRGIAACVKHLAANSQEHARMTSDSVIDAVALHELYLAPFERVIRAARPWAAMSAYNRLNGTYCSEHSWLLQDMLRDAWGFDGVVVSDWGAMSSSVASVRAGLDVCMPGPRPDHAEAISRAVRAGALDPAVIDERVAALRHLSERVERGRTMPYTCDYQRHLEFACTAAAQSAVLLENNGVLPLAAGQSVALVGAFGREARYQGSGSSRVVPTELDSVYDAMLAAGMDVRFALGYRRDTGATDEQLLAEAERTARDADVAVVVAGLPERYESEGFDRKLMVMPAGHVQLIERICAVNPRTVVVLQGGAPMELPWRSLPAAILLMYLSGCQGGSATVDVLTGVVNPAGKLAETWPSRLADTVLRDAYPDMDREVRYRESVFVGYRYYDTARVEVAYPFGFGRSYTTFVYRDMHVESVSNGFSVTCEVENTGDRPGAEVVQIYVAPRDDRPLQPVQWLVGFARVELVPGARRQVKVFLDEHAFRRWDPIARAWVVPAGMYEIRASASSRDVRLRCTVCLDDSSPFPVKQSTWLQADCSLDMWYTQPTPDLPSDVSFAHLYRETWGSELPLRCAVTPFTIDSTVSDMGASWLGRRLFRLIDYVMAGPVSRMDRDQRAMMREMAAEMPLRSLTTSGIPLGAAQGLAAMLNGRYVHGLAQIVRALREAKRAGGQRSI